MPLRDNNPVDGRKLYKEVNDAGQLKDPDVSVPRARGAKPEATATAEPLDEPHGCFDGVSSSFEKNERRTLLSKGEIVSPPRADHPGLRPSCLEK